MYFVGCVAKSFWLLARHGSRNPGDDDIQEMIDKSPGYKQKIIQLHEQGKGKRAVGHILNEDH